MADVPTKFQILLTSFWIADRDSNKRMTRCQAMHTSSINIIMDY
jgi:hypothetical protein